MGTEASDLSMDAAAKKMTTDANEKIKTVKFNVGGRHFEVSRSLFDQHGETVLGKLISDTWQSDPERSIFIDRNGSIFEWILDYLRYGTVELPVTIPKSMFDREMDYYGIQNGTNKSITEHSIYDVREKMSKQIQLSNAQLAKDQRCQDMFAIANYCHFERTRGCHDVYYNNLKTNTVFMHADRNGLSEEEVKLVNEYMSRYYGLVIKGFSTTYDNQCHSKVFCSFRIEKVKNSILEAQSDATKEV